MKTTGILDDQNTLQPYTLHQYDPSPALAHFVEQYWIIRWDLPAGQTHKIKILPYPQVNIAIGAVDSSITGVATSVSYHALEGSGTMLGVKFLPGGFHPFYKKPIEKLTNQVMPLKTVFSSTRIKKITSQLDQPNEVLIQELEKLLLTRRPETDTTIGAIGDIIATVRHDPDIRHQQTVSEALDISERTIQYAFKNYVGIGLKWVILRYRLQDIADAINNGQQDWPASALQYGFTDQPHCIREFKKVFGETPAELTIRTHDSHPPIHSFVGL